MVPRESQMLQVTSEQWSSQMRLGSVKLQADSHMQFFIPNGGADSLQGEIATPVQSVMIYSNV